MDIDSLSKTTNNNKNNSSLAKAEVESEAKGEASAVEAIFPRASCLSIQKMRKECQIKLPIFGYDIPYNRFSGKL